jgi:hypothetical protein
MGIQRRDRNDRVTAGAPPRLKVARGENGELKIAPDQAPEGVHPETIAAEKPEVGDDPRPAMWRDVGGPWGAA